MPEEARRARTRSQTSPLFNRNTEKMLREQTGMQVERYEAPKKKPKKKKPGRAQRGLGYFMGPKTSSN